MHATTADHRDAARIATEAGQLLLEIRKQLDRPDADVRAIRAQGDNDSNRQILAALTDTHPDDPILSEESIDDRRRLESDRAWIVDPLDGTREFGEPDRDDWAVHVALAIGGTPVAGAVALPAVGVA